MSNQPDGPEGGRRLRQARQAASVHHHLQVLFTILFLAIAVYKDKHHLQVDDSPSLFLMSALALLDTWSLQRQT